MSTVQEHEGNLVIVDDWHSDYLKPAQYRQYWPVGVKAKDYQHLIGKEARWYPVWPGEYEVTLLHGAICKIALEHGANTRPCFIEERKLKKPRGAKAWQYGKWVY